MFVHIWKYIHKSTTYGNENLKHYVNNSGHLHLTLDVKATVAVF